VNSSPETRNTKRVRFEFDAAETCFVNSVVSPSTVIAVSSVLDFVECESNKTQVYSQRMFWQNASKNYVAKGKYGVYIPPNFLTKEQTIERDVNKEPYVIGSRWKRKYDLINN
jgi:hypothetical protein